MRKVERIDPITVDALALRDALARALDGGPALSLAPISHQSVPDEIALLILTGGTTGASKLVALSADAMRASASLSNRALGADSRDRWSLSLPLHHIAGINQLLRSIDLQNDPVKSGGEFISVVPTQLYRGIAKQSKELEELRNAKKVLIGGAAVPDNLLRQGRDLGIPLVTSYGMTEMCGGCVYNGEPLPGVEVKILSSGQIALKGPMQATGYFENAVATQESFIDGWFITSDQGVINRDGSLEVIGRVDDVIISGGEKISPRAISEILGVFFPDEEIYVLGIPDTEWGQSVRVVLKTSSLSQKFTLKECREKISQSLGKVAAPRSLLLLSEIPVKSNGKVDYDLLAQMPATEQA